MSTRRTDDGTGSNFRGWTAVALAPPAPAMLPPLGYALQSGPAAWVYGPASPRFQSARIGSPDLAATG